MDIFYQAMMAFLKQKKNSYSYYWPGMDKDISNHIDHCHKYQLRRKAAPPGQVLVTPLPQTTERNQRVHADLVHQRNIYFVSLLLLQSMSSWSLFQTKKPQL